MARCSLEAEAPSDKSRSALSDLSAEIREERRRPPLLVAPSSVQTLEPLPSTEPAEVPGSA